MRRRRWLQSVLAGSAAVAARTGWSQTAARKIRIAGLTPIPRSAVHWLAFYDELRRQGFSQGHNLEVTGYSIAADQIDAAANEMAKAGVDLIVTGGNGPTRAARNATGSIPILTVLDDFIGQNFATSLAHPGGNVTGVSIVGPELDGKRGALLQNLVPGIKDMAALVDPSATPTAEAEKLQAQARERGVALALFTAARREDIAPAIEAIRKSPAQAINVLASQFFNVNRAQILGSISAARLPAIYQWPEWCHEGGLLAYGPRFTTVYRQLARQAAKVMQGTAPASLPIEQPTLFELVINLRTARAMDLPVPLLLLTSADEVIE